MLYLFFNDLTPLVGQVSSRVATHLENLENMEKSGNLRVVRRKSGGKKEKSGKCVLAYGQLPRVLILTQNVQKGISY